ETGAQLHGEGGAGIARIAQFGDQGGELRGVGHHPKPPNQGHADEQGERGAPVDRQPADQQGAAAGEGHGGGSGVFPSAAVTPAAAVPAPNAADGNDQKGGERGAGGAIANPGEGFGQEDADPAPHGDQLPHMTEVAAYGQAGAAVGKNFADLDRIKVRAGER